MTEQDFKNIEFYKEQYLFEYERTRSYDNLIQFPTTLLVIFIGSAFFLLEKYFQDGFRQALTRLDWFFIIALILFSISIILTIFYLVKVFHGYNRAYEVLPFSVDLKKRELELYKHYYKSSNQKNYKKKRKKAKQLTSEMLYKELRNYYIEMTTHNQMINDKRSKFYYRTRTFLSIDLALLIVFAITGYLN